MDLLLGFVVAIGVTMALIPPLIKLAPRWHFVDLPQSRKVHLNPIPRVGGIAMAVGVLIALLVSGRAASSGIALVAAIIVLLIFGVWDDRNTLSAGAKFVGQAIAVLIVMTFGHLSIGSITLAGRFDMPEWLALPITFLFLVGVTNAINLADGLDGLAGGTTLMCLAGLALLAFTVGSPQVGGIAIFVIGAVVGFLRYNTHPARVFMGDSGSQLLGFTAAVLCVMLTQDHAVPLSSALPLLLLGVPIIDTLWVMTARIATGNSPFKADRTHIHHRLLGLAFDHHEAVMIIYVAQAVFFVVAWFMRYESDLAILLAFALLSALIVGMLTVAQIGGWRWRLAAPGAETSISGLRRTVLWLADPRRLPLWCVYAISIAIAVFVLGVLRSIDGTSADVSILSAVALTMSLGSMALRWRSQGLGLFDKVALYLCVTLFVFLRGGSAPVVSGWLPIIATGIAVAVRMRLSVDRRFAVTPLDVLVIIIAALVPNLPNSIASPQALGAAVAQLVVLFYGVETLSIVAQKNWRWLSGAGAAALTAVLWLGL